METVAAALLSGLKTTLLFFWDSLFGLIFGFLISAIVQVAATPKQMERWLGPNVRGILSAAGFGIISSACSYGAAAAARGFYQRGADIRAVFAFLISSTNMNVAIVILFWTLLGWRFAFAEFFGGIIIIAIVVAGFSLLFRAATLERFAEQARALAGSRAAEETTQCPLCGMEGDPAHAVTIGGRTVLACGANHERQLHERAQEDAAPRSLATPATWQAIWQTFTGDVAMLRTDILIGYVVAGFAAALVPAAWLSGALNAVGSVPLLGYPLLLLCGLLIAVLTFVCSMGNVPVARYLALAGIPLGANTAFIYGDLLVPPLVAIYRKSFAPAVVWWFLALFVLGAMVAGASMELALGHGFGGMAAMQSMAVNERFTVISNIVAIVALGTAWAAAKRGAALKVRARLS